MKIIRFVIKVIILCAVVYGLIHAGIFVANYIDSNVADFGR